MSFEWDLLKAAENVRKHGIHLSDAVAALEDPLALTVRDRHRGERRWNTLGRDRTDKVIFLCWTYAGPDRMRLTSARRATARERRLYAEGDHEQER